MSTYHILLSFFVCNLFHGIFWQIICCTHYVCWFRINPLLQRVRHYDPLLRNTNCYFFSQMYHDAANARWFFKMTLFPKMTTLPWRMNVTKVFEISSGKSLSDPIISSILSLTNSLTHWLLLWRLDIYVDCGCASRGSHVGIVGVSEGKILAELWSRYKA